MQGAYAVVRGGSSTSNVLEPHHRRYNKVWRVLLRELLQPLLPFRDRDAGSREGLEHHHFSLG